MSRIASRWMLDPTARIEASRSFGEAAREGDAGSSKEYCIADVGGLGLAADARGASATSEATVGPPVEEVEVSARLSIAGWSDCKSRRTESGRRERVSLAIALGVARAESRLRFVVVRGGGGIDCSRLLVRKCRSSRSRV